ncbi:39S ribosomal protein L12, mitochondrial-like [Agrilus planipennis]|uniref:39S ribosomal protein L12, mitochondrial n=1 Tax=Agrilus planipennis TaxID=224129 RepID=A0A1W4XEQ2_AGRPL|nr:39S ribosomal protein L12, mitochondrial [Agrilus planipennis]XP_025832306.1 39S ribosomal protein L12, mitochondrial-like [Agrilus planipennis]
MQAVRISAKSTFGKFRNLSRCTSCLQNVEAAKPTESLTVPPPSNVDKPVSPKIEKLAFEISSLTLIEVSELSGFLKKKLNLPDTPAFPVGGFIAAQAGGKSEEDEEAPKAKKTSFTVKLTKYDEKQKIPLIKEIKGLLEGMNLVQAKKFVEGVPAVVKADISQDEADKLKEVLTKVGGVVEIE